MDLLAQIVESEVTVAGQVASGFLFASVKNIGNATAIVNGVALKPGEAKSYPFVGKGYLAVPYDPQGTTLLVMQII